jgi:hypothetical protein
VTKMPVCRSQADIKRVPTAMGMKAAHVDPQATSKHRILPEEIEQKPDSASLRRSKRREMSRVNERNDEMVEDGDGDETYAVNETARIMQVSVVLIV